MGLQEKCENNLDSCKYCKDLKEAIKLFETRLGENFTHLNTYGTVLVFHSLKGNLTDKKTIQHLLTSTHFTK